jgi:hypothetical protein
VVEVAIAIAEYVIRCGVDEVEVIEGFEDNDEITRLDEPARGR